MLRVLLLVLAVALGALAVPSSAGALVIGIADQKPDMFDDARFADLEIRHARLQVGWDVLRNRPELERVDHWLAAAQRDGVTPLVSFGHSQRPRSRRVLPSPERLKFEFKEFRERFPQVTSFAVWNEANHCGEPTCNRPSLVASYYKKLRSACSSCTILAAELLDLPNMARWVRDFRRALGYDPKLWGLHNYVDTNRFRTTGTRRLLAATRGRIWLTETGGIVARRNRSTIDIPEGPAHAARATRFLFDRLVPLSPRIERVYVYHWNSDTRRDTWDSALVASNGQTRTSLLVLERVLKEDRRRGESPAAARRRAAAARGR